MVGGVDFSHELPIVPFALVDKRLGEIIVRNHVTNHDIIELGFDRGLRFASLWDDGCS